MFYFLFFFLLVHLNAEQSKQCKFPGIKDVINMPVYFINLESAVGRRFVFEKEFGCLNLSRIVGVEYVNENSIAKFIENDLDAIAGDIGISGTWDGKSFLRQNRTSSFYGALGCTLSHLVIALEVHKLGYEKVLVLEDDASSELFPFWYGNIDGWLSALSTGWSALQLSAIGLLPFWNHVFDQSRSQYRRQSIFHDTWYSSTTAYVLSAKGASELISTFYNEKTKKFNLSPLKCINADLCLTRHFLHPYVKMPPYFIPHLRLKSSITHTTDSSEQQMMFEVSRHVAERWSKMTDCRNRLFNNLTTHLTMDDTTFC